MSRAPVEIRLRNDERRGAMHELFRVQELLEQSWMSEQERDLALGYEAALKELLTARRPRGFLGGP